MATPDQMTSEYRRSSIPLLRRLSFRAVALAFAAVALPFGGTIYGQQENIREVERLGGKLLRLGGGGTRIEFCGCQVTDADLKTLAALEHVKFLFLDETQVSDAGLAHLAEVARLEGLSLNGTLITDAGMKNLQNQTRLVWLKLNNTRVTDAGLARLKPLTGLRDLYLAETDLSDTALADLQGALPKLRIWAPDLPAPDLPKPDDAHVAFTTFQAGMPLRSVVTALRKQGIRVCESDGMDVATDDPGRFLRQFEVYPKFKTPDVLFLDATCDRERGVYVIDRIYWWIDFENDAKRAKRIRRYDFRPVGELDVKNLTASPRANKSR
ncbi:MAG: leucine-rich repeat domain-containing protein [Planctomycetales bacterium]